MTKRLAFLASCVFLALGYASGAHAQSSLWGAGATPVNPDHGPDSAVELGVRFVSDVNGYVTGIRFYKGAGNSGVHVGNLWTTTGTNLASATFAGETATGWQQVDFAQPVAITAGTAYVASYHTNVGHYAADIGFFANQGVDSAPLHAQANGVAGGNGRYAYGATSSFPANTYSSTNYWVDVVFSRPAPATITVSTVTPSVSTGAVAQFTATATYEDGSSQDVTSEVTWTSSQADVASIGAGGVANGLTPGTTSITATLGSVTGSTSLTVQATPLFVTTAVLPNGSEGTAYAAQLGAIGGAPPYTWSLVSGALPPGLNLAPGGDLSGIPWASGEASFTVLVADALGTTATQSLSIGILTPGVGIWSVAATPGTPDHGPDSAVELGVRFISDVSGYVEGIRFYKGAGNTGIHVGNLWTSAGVLLASATFTGETATGWQQVLFAAPVPIAAGTTYVASYHTNVGHYAADIGYFATGVDHAPLHAPADGVVGGNGAYMYGPTSSYPANTYIATNYWVDVVFSPPPLTAITVSTATPLVPTGATGQFTATATYADGSTQDVTSQVAWTSSDLAVATVGSLGLASAMGPGTTDIVATQGSVSGSTTLTVNLTPLVVTTASLPVGVQGTSYAALLQATGGLPPYSWSVTSPGLPSGLILSASGTISGTPTAAGIGSAAVTVIDSAGNTAMQQVGTCIVAPGISIWPATAAPTNPDHGADSSVELGVRFVSDVDGFVEGIRFYKGAGNTGVHVGNLWAASGTLLASATFTGETATGWQQVSFAEPVAITAGTAYVASYHTNVGHYAADLGFFARSGADNAPLHAPADGVGGGNGRYAYGATSVFPASTYVSTNYWVDLVFSPQPPSSPGSSLVVVTPPSGTVVPGTSTDVSVSAIDPVGIAAVQVNGISLSTGTDGLYHGTVGLVPGPNILAVTATNLVGSTLTASVLVVSGSGTTSGGAGSATVTLDTNGGTVSLPGGPTLDVPPGALTAATTIAIAQEGAAVQSSGPVYRFSPDGTSFLLPATAHFPVPPGLVRPTVYWTTGGSPPQFRPLATTVSGNVASAQISHFSWGYVGSAPLASIAVATAAPNVPVGTTVQVTALGTFADGSTSDITSQVTWISSDLSVATITADGVLTAVGPGSVTIAAAVGPVIGTLIVAGEASCTATAATSLAVAVTYPSQGFTVTTSSLAVQGVATGGSPPLTLSVNGIVTPTSAAGTFGTMLPTTAGMNTIVVQATDSVGRTASAIISGMGPPSGGGWTGGSGGTGGTAVNGANGGGGTQQGAPAAGPIRFAYDSAGNLTAIVDTSSDVKNCGALGMACPQVDPASGTVACMAGICGVVRSGQFLSIWSDPFNCGQPPVQCAAPANSSAVCTNGTCGFGCDSGYLMSSDGSACIDLQSDPLNCGYLNNACQNGAACSYGTCVAQGVPAPCSVNDVGIGGLAFKAPSWEGIRIAGAGLDSVTYVELEDWGADTDGGDPELEVVPWFTGRVITTQQRGGQLEPMPIPFWSAPDSLVIPQAALQYMLNFGSYSFDWFGWREWYKVRLHYLSYGIDSSLLVDVAVSLDDQAPVTLPPPKIVGVSTLKAVRLPDGGYDPSTGFVRTYDGSMAAWGADPTTFRHPPTALLAYDDPLETEYPIYAITHEGVFIQAGLDPERVQKIWSNGEAYDVTLVFPYTDPSTDRVDLRGRDDFEWPLPPGGVILRGTNLVGGGVVRIAAPDGTTLPGDLSAAELLEQRIVIRSIYGVQDLTGIIEFDSDRGVSATPQRIAWLSAPLITGIGTVPWIVYDQVMNITGQFFAGVSSVVFSGGDASEFLTPAPSSPPGPEQYFVIDDKSIQIMLSSNGVPVSRQLYAYCSQSGAVVETFPGQRTFQVAAEGGVATSTLDALDPSSIPPRPPYVYCAGMQPIEMSGGTTSHPLTPPAPSGGGLPVPPGGGGGGCDLTNKTSPTPCYNPW